MTAEAFATALGAILTSVGSIFSSALSMAGTVGSTIVGSPLLLVFCVLPLVGLGVGLFRRLINV